MMTTEKALDEAEIRRQVEKWAEAIRSGDVERVAADGACRTRMVSSAGPHHPRLRNARSPGSTAVLSAG